MERKVSCNQKAWKKNKLLLRAPNIKILHFQYEPSLRLVGSHQKNSRDFEKEQ